MRIRQILIATILTVVFPIENGWVALAQSTSERTLASAPAEVLILKKLKNADTKIAFSKAAVFASNSEGIFSFDLATGEQVMMKESPQKTAGNRLIIMAGRQGAYVANKKQILLYSQGEIPRVVHTFNSDIRWSESNGNFAVVLTRAGDVAILTEEKVTVVGKTNGGDLRISGDFIELMESPDTSSGLVKRYSATGEVAKCQVSERVKRLALTNDGSLAVGIIIKSDIPYVAGVECKSQTVLWRKKVHGEVLRNVQGVDSHFRQQVLAMPGNCGDYICLNLSDSRITMGGNTESGVYCVEPRSGEVKWKFIKTAENDRPSSMNANFLTPMVCTRERLAIFQNGGSIIYSQDFPTKIDEAVEYLSSTAINLLKRETSSKSPVITNWQILPQIHNGKLGFVTTSSKVVVVGK